MKNVWKKLAVVVMSAAMCTSMCLFTACDASQGPKGDTGATGAQGPQGETGPQGPKGDKGDKGDQGIQGIQGEKGEDGTKWYTGHGLPAATLEANKGDFYVDLDANKVYVKGETSWTELFDAKGDKGDKGDQGIQGIQGIQGAQGIQGEKGDKGDTGATGAAGADGKDGEDGADGKDGTQWYTGKGLPSDTLEANEGDFYIDLNNDAIYKKTEKGWELIINSNKEGTISKWDGKITGWTKLGHTHEEVVAARPLTYVVEDDYKTVDIYDAEAFAWFAYRSIIGDWHEGEGGRQEFSFKDYTVNLHCDIDLDNHLWVPIGLGARNDESNTYFEGTFNGNGHTIYNLNANAFFDAIEYGTYQTDLTDDDSNTGYHIHYDNQYGDGADETVEVIIPIEYHPDDTGLDEIHYGLFGTAQNATFKNINIQGVSIDSFQKKKFTDNHTLVADSVAVLLGYGLGDVTIENVTVGNPDGTDKIEAYSTAAGIVGRVYSGKGGLDKDGNLGRTPPYGKILITNSKNYVNIKMTNKKIEKVGGIIAYPNRYGELTVTDCINYGNIEGGYAGGILGYANTKDDQDAPMNINGCTNYGVITGQYVGGAVGYLQPAALKDNKTSLLFISRFVNFGNVKAELKYLNKEEGDPLAAPVSSAFAGGTLGYISTKTVNVILMDCYNFAEVTAVRSAATVETKSQNKTTGVITTGTATTVTAAGAIAGRIQLADNVSTVTYSGYNMGDVTVTDSTQATPAVTTVTTAIGSLTKSSSSITAKANVIYFINKGEITSHEPQTAANE